MAEQQTSAPRPHLGNPGETCCGVNFPGNEKQPLAIRCQLCPQASIYYAAEPGYLERSRQRIIGGELPERAGR